MESRIEILDRLAKKHGNKDGINDFTEFIHFYSAEAVIMLTRIAMAEYARQSINEINNKKK